MRPTLEHPIKLTLSVTDACPLDCAHCYGRCTATPSEAELDTRECLDLLQQAHDAGVIGVLLEGGEPLLRPDIFEILQFCHGRFLTWLRTHALDITAGVAARLAALGVATVSVDLFGADAAVHDAHSGVPGSFARTCAGIALLRAAGLRVVPLMILTRRNIGQVQAYAELAGRLGCARAAILRLYPVGRARDRWAELACGLPEMTAALAALRPPRGVTILQSWHPRNGNCCWENAAVTATGTSVGCPYLRDFVDYGNIRDQPFLDTWSHPLHRRLRAGPEGEHWCPDCRGTEGTTGGCRATAYAFAGDWDAPDPFCPKQNHGIDLRAAPVAPVVHAPLFPRPAPAAAAGA